MPFRGISVLIVIAAWGGLLLSVPGAGAAEEPEQLGPHDPQRQLESFELHEDFEVNLFAAEPMITNPIHMTWDPQGRLWVACSTSYPHLKPGDEADDRIIILEDTDGDGRADERTVFADGLYIPTGLALGDGGVYVANQTELLFLKDTDGDDKADLRRTMLSGFGMADSHHAISAWTWGPGGWLYFQEGTFMHTNVETPHGVTRLVNGGVFQYRPRRQRFRVYADYHASNPWGHGFDRWGQEILIDNPRMFALAPMTANNRTKVRFQESTRATTKLCGGQFVSGRHLPEAFRGEYRTNMYKSHDVARYRVVDDGAGFDYEAREPILKSNNEHFRPVDLEVGPRGAVYVLDWYDALIGHMQHSMRDPRRDKTHGRVWRIIHKDRPLREKPDLTDASLPELLDHLKAPEDWTRYQVKRVLYDTPPEKAAKALSEWVDALDPEAEGFEHHRLEALWAFQTIGVVNEELLRAVLGSDDHRARAAAVRVVRYWQDRISRPLDLLADAVRDEHPRVRMEAVLSAGFVPERRSVKVALKALDRPTDRYVTHALQRTVDGLQSHWLPAYRSDELSFAKDAHRNFALSNVRSSDTVKNLVQLLTSGAVEMDQLEGPLRFVADRASAQQLDPLIGILTEQTRGPSPIWGTAEMPHEGLARILDAVAEAGIQRGVQPDGMPRLMHRTRKIDHPAVQKAWARLAGAVGFKGANGRLRKIVRRDGEPFELRRTAAEALGRLGGGKNVNVLKKLTESESGDDAVLGVTGIAANNLHLAAERAAAVLGRASAAKARIGAMLEALLRRKGGASVLADALDDAEPHADAAEKAMDYLGRIGEQNEQLLSAIRPDTSETPLTQRLLNEDREQLLAAIKNSGRPERGQRLFRSQTLACDACHGLAGAGPRLGPDLATIGSSAPLNYLLESVLQPNKLIKQDFQSATVITKSGTAHTGILKSETEDRIRLLDRTDGEMVTIDQSQIQQRVEAPSLMPSGLIDRLESRQQVLDLMSYLRQLGRPGEYETTTEPVLREWELAALDADPGSVEPGSLSPETSWRSTFATIRGDLPRWLYASDDEQPTVVARSRIELGQPGRLRLRLNDATGIRAVRIGGRDVAADKTAQALSLNAGRHTVTLVIDVRQRGDRPLRVTAEKVGE